MNARKLILKTNRHVDFRYVLDTYVIYPWIRDGDELVRPLQVGAEGFYRRA